MFTLINKKCSFRRLRLQSVFQKNDQWWEEIHLFHGRELPYREKWAFIYLLKVIICRIIIFSASRNRCRSCRLQKCLSVGMSESHLRDFKPKNPMDPFTSFSTSKQSKKEVPTSKNPTSPIRVCNLPQNEDVSGLLNSLHLKTAKSANIIEFLTSMTKTCLNSYDPTFTNLTKEDWERIEKNFGRTISLSDGLRNPELVCPRTKWDWSCSRVAELFDLPFMWYRFFVTVADWANSIPQFRMIPKDDQLQLIRLNFLNISMTFVMYFLLGNPSLKENVPMGNGSYVSKVDNNLVWVSIYARLLER